MPVNILVSGPQGSGKTTQAKLIAEKFKLNFIDSGSVLRESFHTPLGVEAKKYIDEGHYVPEPIYDRIMKEYIETHFDKEKGFVFTGFPRTIPQIGFMEGVLGIELDKVIELEVSPEEFIRRMKARAEKEHRSDDTDEAIKERLKEYQRKDKAVIEHYREKGLVTDVNGEGDVEAIFERILQVLL